MEGDARDYVFCRKKPTRQLGNRSSQISQSRKILTQSGPGAVSILTYPATSKSSTKSKGAHCGAAQHTTFSNLPGHTLEPPSNFGATRSPRSTPAAFTLPGPWSYPNNNVKATRILEPPGNLLSCPLTFDLPGNFQATRQPWELPSNLGAIRRLSSFPATLELPGNLGATRQLGASRQPWGYPATLELPGNLGATQQLRSHPATFKLLCNNFLFLPSSFQGYSASFRPFPCLHSLPFFALILSLVESSFCKIF